MAEVEKIVDPYMGENSYVVFKEEGKQAIVIDPALQVPAILACLKRENLTCAAILLTHGHFDHIAGIDILRDETGAPVYIHKLDAEMLSDPQKNKSTEMGNGISMRPAEHLLEEPLNGQEAFVLAGLGVRVLETPGHTIGSVCYIIEDQFFSGDTLFNMSIGRTDFPESDSEKMRDSMDKLKAIKEDYVVHPGHGSSTSFKYEVINNPYLGDGQWLF